LDRKINSLPRQQFKASHIPKYTYDPNVGSFKVDIIPTNISETAELSGSGNFGEYRIDFVGKRNNSGSFSLRASFGISQSSLNMVSYG